MGVNCASARRLCLPDIVPAEAFVRAGAVLRGVGGFIAAPGGWGMPDIAFGSVGLLDVSAKQDGDRYASFLFRAGQDRRQSIHGGSADIEL